MSGGSLLLAFNILLALSFFIHERFLEERKELEVRTFEERSEGGAGPKEAFRPDTLHPFDPNEASLERFMDLGLTEDEAEVLIHYRESGGSFHEKEDLLKVYSIGKEELEAWDGYLRFPSKKRGRDKAEKDPAKASSEQEVESLELFPFDPNRLPAEEWTRLGLPPERVRTLEKYRQRGGTFWKASDLLDLYGVDSSLFQKWEPYVRIDREELKLPIDTAGSDRLTRLPGIGKVRSERIVEYRELLGGFRKVEQLKEVYGISDSLYGTLVDRVKIEEGKLEPLALDASAERLMKHPYISPGLAEAIVEHRERFGAVREKEELLELDLMNDREYRKIAPYLHSVADER